MATIFKNATGSDLTSTASWADPGTPVPYWTDINHGGGEVKTVLRHPTTGGYFVGGTFGLRYIAPDGTITNGPTFSGGTATVHDIMWAQSLPGVTTAGIVVAGTFTTVTVGGVASTRHQIAVLSPAMTTLYGAAQTIWSNGAVYTLCPTSWTTNYTNLMFVGGDFSYTPPCTNCATARVEENLSHFTLSADLSTLTYRRHADSSGSDSSAAHAFIGTSSEYASPCVLKVVSSGANVYIFGDFTTYGYRKYGSFPNYVRNGAAAFTITPYAANPTVFLEFNPQAWDPNFQGGIPYTAAVAPEGIYVGGSFQTAAGANSANLSLVNPTVTSTAFLSCATTNGPVHDIRYYDGPSGDGAVIAGNFTSPRKYVAMVNGADVMGWLEERVTPRTSPVKALAVTSGLVFAGGSATDQSSEQTNISNFTVSSVAPTIADDAIWKSWSLGGAYTGNISANSFTFDGAHGDITHPSGSSATVGSGGLTFGPNNSTSWNEYGTINVGSTNQTWALSNTVGASSLRFYGATSLSGSATINVTNNSTSFSGLAGINSAGANAGFTGTFVLNDYVQVYPTSASSLINANIVVTGSNCVINPGNASGDVLGSSAGSLVVNNNLTLGYAGRSFTIASPVQMGSSKRTLSIAGGTTLSSHMSGTAGVAVQTTGSITLGITGPQSSISGPLDLESNTSGYGMLIGNPTGTPNQLSNITELNLNGAIYYDGNASYTEDAILNATGPRAALISRGVLALSDSSQSTFGGELWCQSNVGAYTTAQMTLNHPPEDATRFRAQVQGVTSQTGYNTRFIFNNPTGSIIPGDISLSLITVATQAAGAISILEDNSSGNEFTGFVSGSQVSAAFLNLGLQGSSTGSILSGNIVTGATTMGITKTGTGTWTIRGNNNHTGTNKISSGTLSLQSSAALGSTAAGVVTQEGGTIEVTGGTALNKGTLGWTLASVSGASALKSTSGTNSIACGPITMSHTLPIDVATGASLEIKNSSAMSGGGMGITKIGAGELILSSSANTYTGLVTISDGILSALTMANSGSVSSLGTGAATSSISLTGTLKFIGSSVQSTNRSITLSGASPTLDASGTGIGAITFSVATQTNTAKSIVFTGSNTNNNTASFNIGNSSATTGVTKTGSGNWILSGTTLSYTGTTTVSEGTLNLGGTARSLTGGLSITGGTLQNGSATLTSDVTASGGSILCALAGSGKTFDVVGGEVYLYPPSENTYTGGTTVDSAAVLTVKTDANPSTVGSGKVLGTGSTIVDGELRTAAGGDQKGKLRYGGGLTFGTGAKLHIGSAA
jgi:autotransporter-associated beta strand protein